MNYVERHFGDWARDTAHLSMLEDGAYNRLVDLYYVREEPLPLDLSACCRLVRAVSKQEREAVRSVLAEFFVQAPEGWAHKRCDAEIERYRTKSGKARASANARWGADRSQSDGNANAHANASPNAMRTHSDGMTNALPHAGAGGRAPTPQTPSTSSVANATAADAAPAMSVKDRVWALGIALLGEKGRAKLGKLVATHGEAQVLEALQAASREQPGDPYPWLVAACEARASPAKVNGAQADLLADPRPAWAIDAGFPDRFQAENAGCLPHNARKFRDGKRVEAA